MLFEEVLPQFQNIFPEGRLDTFVTKYKFSIRILNGTDYHKWMHATPDPALTQKLEQTCKTAGADIFGCADPATLRQFSKDNRPEKFLAGIQTIVVVGIHLYDIVLDTWSQPPGSGKGYQFADQILEGICHFVADFLTRHDYASVTVPYAGLLLKDIAAVAGMGPIGKNNLLLTPQFGPQVRLRALVTTAPLTCGTPVTTSEYCIACQRCIDACPAKAFAKGSYDRDTCEAYQLSHLQHLSDQSTIWCNACIESCPVGHHST
jgi:epoxyqueuosine reductase QueG